MANKKKKKSKAEDEWWTATSPIGQSVYLPTRDKKLREKRPHSTPEGRWADVKKMFKGNTSREEKLEQKPRRIQTNFAGGG